MIKKTADRASKKLKLHIPEFSKMSLSSHNYTTVQMFCWLSSVPSMLSTHGQGQFLLFFSTFFAANWVLKHLSTCFWTIVFLCDLRLKLQQYTTANSTLYIWPTSHTSAAYNTNAHLEWYSLHNKTAHCNINVGKRNFFFLLRMWLVYLWKREKNISMHNQLALYQQNF